MRVADELLVFERISGLKVGKRAVDEDALLFRIEKAWCLIAVDVYSSLNCVLPASPRDRIRVLKCVLRAALGNDAVDAEVRRTVEEDDFRPRRKRRVHVECWIHAAKTKT